MRVVISAGGTGGHIYPALAIIDEIKRREPNSEFLYIGTHNRMEKDIIPGRGIPFKQVEIYGLNKKHIFKTMTCLLKSFKTCKKIIKDFNPDVVIGVGGYVTVPVIISAKKLGYKTFVHEQNSIPGKANKLLAKYCDAIGVSFKSSMESLPKDKTILTGNPCSDNAIKAIPVKKEDLGLDPNKKLVLVAMGSLGSASINRYLVKNLSAIEGKNYEVLLITGKGSYDEVAKNKFPSNVKILPFYEGLTSVMKKTDLLVSRAGASTLSEIIALSLPSILIPSPYVPNNHQYINAMDLVKDDAALLLEEKDMKSDELIKMIDAVIDDDKKLNTMKENLSKFKLDNSASIIYNKIKEITNEKWEYEKIYNL